MSFRTLWEAAAAAFGPGLGRAPRRLRSDRQASWFVRPLSHNGRSPQDEPDGSPRIRATMTKATTPSGTPVLEFSPSEWDTYLLDEVERATGLRSIEDFEAAYQGGQLDEDDPNVSALASLLWVGQDGGVAA